MSTTAIDLSVLSAEQIAGLQALGLIAPATTPAKAPAKAKTVTAAAKASPFAGKTLAEMQEAIDASPANIPLVKAELTARINRPNAKVGAVKRAQGALDRLATGGPVTAPKGEKASAFDKTPEELVADAQAKLADHTRKLQGEQAAVSALQATIQANPGVVAASLAQPLEQAQRAVTRRMEWIAIQTANVTKHGGTVHVPTAKRTRSNKRVAA